MMDDLDPALDVPRAIESLDKALDIIASKQVDKATRERVQRCFAHGDPEEFDGIWKDSELFATLQKVRDTLRDDPTQRSIVVDNAESTTEDGLWLSLAKYTDLSLSYCSVRTLEPPVLEGTWSRVDPIPGPRGSALLSRRGLACLVSDQPGHVVTGANVLAAEDGEAVVLRILRVAPRACLGARIRSVLAEPTPDNVVHVWIRHHEEIDNMKGLGKFRYPLDTHATVTELLTEIDDVGDDDDDLHSNSPFCHNSAPTPASHPMYVGISSSGRSGGARSASVSQAPNPRPLLFTRERTVSSLSSPGSVFQSPSISPGTAWTTTTTPQSSFSSASPVVVAVVNTKKSLPPITPPGMEEDFIFEEPHDGLMDNCDDGGDEEPLIRESTTLFPAADEHQVQTADPSVAVNDPLDAAAAILSDTPTSSRSVTFELPPSDGEAAAAQELCTESLLSDTPTGSSCGIPAPPKTPATELAEAHSNEPDVPALKPVGLSEPPPTTSLVVQSNNNTPLVDAQNNDNAAAAAPELNIASFKDPPTSPTPTVAVEAQNDVDDDVQTTVSLQDSPASSCILAPPPPSTSAAELVDVRDSDDAPEPGWQGAADHPAPPNSPLVDARCNDEVELDTTTSLQDASLSPRIPQNTPSPVLVETRTDKDEFQPFATDVQDTPLGSPIQTQPRTPTTVLVGPRGPDDADQELDTMSVQESPSSPSIPAPPNTPATVLVEDDDVPDLVKNQWSLQVEENHNSKQSNFAKSPHPYGLSETPKLHIETGSLKEQQAPSLMGIPESTQLTEDLSLANLSETENINFSTPSSAETDDNKSPKSLQCGLSPEHSVLSALAFMGEYDPPEITPWQEPKQPLATIQVTRFNQNHLQPSGDQSSFCKSCQQTKDKSEFSKNQLKKKSNKRCIECVQTGRKTIFAG